MGRLEERFNELQRRGEGALITYFPLDGGPSPVALANVYAEAGADVLEIGFPVANPFLDGATIRASMQRASAAGWATARYFEAIAGIRRTNPALVLQVFAYHETLAAFGPGDFIGRCADAGADALLVVGADKVALHGIHELAQGRLTPLHFLPHRATAETIARLRPLARGYLFVQSVDGVTGARSDIAPTLAPLLQSLRQSLPGLPLCAGFGISSPSQCVALRQLGADGVIVGSTAVDHLQKGGTQQLGRYLRSLKAALGPTAQ
jgi:tryptophan synthase alpha chain